MIFDRYTHAHNVWRKTDACLIHCSQTSQRIIVHCVAARAQAATARRPCPHTHAPAPANMTDGRVQRDLIYWLAAWPQNVQHSERMMLGRLWVRSGRSDKTIVDGIGRMCACVRVVLSVYKRADWAVYGMLGDLMKNFECKWRVGRLVDIFIVHVSGKGLQIQFELLSIAKWGWIINDSSAPDRSNFGNNWFWSKNCEIFYCINSLIIHQKQCIHTTSPNGGVNCRNTTYITTNRSTIHHSRNRAKSARWHRKYSL